MLDVVSCSSQTPTRKKIRGTHLQVGISYSEICEGLFKPELLFLTGNNKLINNSQLAA